MIKKSSIGNTDFVFGQRNFEGMPLKKRIGNIILSRLHRGLFSSKDYDISCGQMAMTSDSYKNIRDKIGSDYCVESNIKAWASINKKKVEYVTVKTIYKNEYKGTGIKDGIIIAWDMIAKKILKY